MRRSRARTLWLMQAVSGVALAFLLGAHWVVQHLVATGGLRDYAAVKAYLSHPGAVALEALFLALVVLHALLGVRAIVTDLGLTPRGQRRWDLGLALLGVLALGYGGWLLWVLAR